VRPAELNLMKDATKPCQDLIQACTKTQGNLIGCEDGLHTTNSFECLIFL
jgi:hypothetical protein